MSTFRIFFRHGQAHDYEAASAECDWQRSRVRLLDAEGNRVVEYRDSDIVHVMDISPTATGDGN
jgi:hypothetical protein